MPSEPGSSTRVPADASRDAAALRRVFDPASIVIVGASSDPSKRGFQSIRALSEAGYNGHVFPVNPRGGEILGLPVFSTLSEIPGEPDVALIATPATTVPGLLRECAAAGIAGAVVLANGFRESGPEGAALEAELRTAVQETGVRVIGPNTSGIFSASTGTNLVGVPDVPAGSVSIVTQSGNMLISLVTDNKLHHGPGFDSYIGLGNQADIGYVEALDYLGARDTTSAIAVYLEGPSDGRAMLAAISRVSRTKPVVILRGGRSQVGKRAVLSHTGSIAADDRVAVAVLRQAGAEVVDRSDELSALTGVMATTAPVPTDTSVAILSDGGGHAALAADALSAAGVTIASLTTSTRSRLTALLGPRATVANPVDVAGATDSDPSVFARCAEILAADTNVGLIMIVGLFGGYHLRFDSALAAIEDAAAHRIGALSDQGGVSVIVQSCYAEANPSNHQILRRHGVAVLGSIDHAARAASALVRRGRYLASVNGRGRLDVDMGVRDSADAEGLTALTEPDARELLARAGFASAPWRLARTAQEALHAVESLGRPCAMKVVSPQVVHKSDVGGVRLAVSAADAEATFDAIRDAVRAAVPGASIIGVLITPMAGRGIELFVGASIDATFGPIVAFGGGGELVELLDDATIRSAPCTMLEAREMIAETRVDALLTGVRSLPAVDRDRVAALIVAVSELIARQPAIRELDLNPIIASGENLTAVDVRVVTDRSPTPPVGHGR